VPDGQFVETFEKQGPVGSYPKCTNPSPGVGADCFKDKFIETLPGGVTHSILNMGNGSLDDTPVYTVPEGHYFFMGDNRDDSTDSRVAQQGGGVGYVQAEYLIGRADRIMFSSAGRSLLFFWTWRPDRFFKAIE
jgi:signal peptidase I